MISFKSWLSKSKNSFSPRSNEEDKTLTKYQHESGEANRVLQAKHVFGEPEPKKIGSFDVKKFDDLTNRKLGKNIEAYSGLGYNPLKHSKDGHMFVPAYMSTSLEKHVADEFARKRKGEDHRHMLHLHLGKENKGISHKDDDDYDSDYDYDSEKEFTLPRNSKIHIFKSEVDKVDPSLMIHHATVTHDHNPKEEESDHDTLKMNAGWHDRVSKHLTPENAEKYNKLVPKNYQDVWD